MIEGVCKHFIVDKERFWPEQYVKSLKDSLLIQIFVRSHSHCELDFYCPFVVLLQCVEKLWRVSKEIPDDLKNFILSINHHFTSNLHFTDFDVNQTNLLQRVRAISETGMSFMGS